MDEEITSFVTKLIATMKLAEAQGKNPNRVSTKDFFLMNIGEGRFCDVFMCCDKTTRKEVAVKLFKDTRKKEDIEREVSMLEEISLRNPFNVNLLKRCEHDGRTCLVFEKLQQTLVEFTGQKSVLYSMRVIAKQLFLALDELKALNIVHGDIHPGNVMFVHMRDHPSCLKLVDFSMAIKASDAQPGMELQTLEYRAPEIFLGLPFTEAIDLWGVGCTLAYFFLGHNLFSASSEDQMVKRIVEFLGQPEDHLLRSGKYTQRYFTEDEAATWSLREQGQQKNNTDKLSCLDDLLQITSIFTLKTYQDYEDTVAFVDLLKRLLHVDGNQRISARQALQHPFITMDHLTNHFEKGIYLDRSLSAMEKCAALSEYSKDQPTNWTHLQEFPGETTQWDQECRYVLQGSSSSYTVQEKIGQGSFCHVARCQNNTTNEKMVVKIPRMCWEDEVYVEPELSTFEKINARNPASNYLIRFFERCEYRGRTCLVVEMLDKCLREEIMEHGKMTLCSIRPIAKQLFLALDELKAVNIRHNNIHEGNVMLVNRKDQPHRVKLIDFGRACEYDEDDDEDDDEDVDEAVDEAVDEDLDEDDDEYHDDEDEYVYKAENEYVFDNVKSDYKNTDMSDVGKLLVYLYLGYRIKPDEFDIERKLVLCEESESEESDSEESDSESESVDSQVENTSQMSENKSTDQHSTESEAESEDRIAFADLLKQMLHVDKNQRISTCQALQHPFITMDHLMNRVETREYLDASQATMNECPAFSKDAVKSSSVCPLTIGSPDGVPVASSEGAKPTDVTPAVSASSGGPRKLLQRIRRFFRRVKKSDGKIPTVPDGNDPDVCPSDGEIPPVSDKDNSEVCLSGGARSSEGATPTDVTPDVSASSGGLRKLLKRISKIKDYFRCSVYMED